MRILRNRAKCLLCGDVIESKTRHDFVTCSCGNLSVDGGTDYLKRGFGDAGSWEDMSEVQNNLKDLFEERSINVKAFAENNGLNTCTLYSILGNDQDKMRNIGIGNFQRIAKGFGMTMEELYDRVVGE